MGAFYGPYVVASGNWISIAIFFILHIVFFVKAAAKHASVAWSLLWWVFGIVFYGMFPLPANIIPNAIVTLVTIAVSVVVNSTEADKEKERAKVFSMATQCPKCRHWQVANSANRFCEKCGSPLQQAAETPTSFCPECGHKLNPEDRFCGNCGTEIKR